MFPSHRSPSHRLARFAIFVSLLGSSAAPLACDKTGESSTHPGALSSQGWHVVNSTHFEIIGTIKPAELEALATTFEREQAALEIALYHNQLKTDLHTRIVVFRNQEEYEHLREKKGSGGFATSWLGGELERTPTIVFSGTPEKRTLATFRHELTHRLLGFSMRDIPTWLNEGLAGYHEGTHLEGDEIVLGEAPLKMGITKMHEFLYENGGSQHRVSVPLNWLHPFDKLESMTHEEFYNPYTKAKDERDAWEARHTCYTSAWHAVHTLMHGPEPIRAAFFDALVQASSSGSAAKSMDKMIESVGIDVLNKAFYDHANRRETIYWRTSMPAIDVGQLSQREVLPEDVDALLVRLSDRNVPTHKAALDRLIAGANAGSMQAQVQVSALLIGTDPAKAESILRKALASDPNDAQLSALYLQVQLDQSAINRQSEAALLESAVQTLQQSATSAGQLRVLGEYYYRTGKFAEAMTATKRSVQANSSDPDGLELLARITFEIGDAKDAYATQRMAIDRLSERESEARQQRFLSKLHAYQDSAGIEE